MTTDEKVFLDENGYVVLQQVIDTDAADELRERTLELAAQERAAGGESALYLDGTSQRVWNLVNKGECFERALVNPRILEFQEYLLGDDCVLSSFTGNLIGPGASPSDLHIDFPMGEMPVPLPAWTFCANSVYILTDFTKENGATCVIPGSHGRGFGPKHDETCNDIIQLEGAKGDAVVVNGLIWHGSGANHTDSMRVGLLGFYCRSFIRPQQDHLELVSEDVWQRATPAMRRLLGENAKASARY